MMRRMVPDVAPLDLMMPDMHGLELDQRLKASSKPRRMPLIVVSVIPHIGLKLEALQVEVFAKKPFLAGDLSQRVAEAHRTEVS